jgi:nucleoside-diphosphate-sugar epimerase
MRYVVTGGAGFVGSNLTKLLVKEGHDVLVIDNLVKGKKENLTQVFDQIEFVKGDIRDYDDMEKNFQDIDGVFHQAALTVVQDSFDNTQEYHDVNVVGTENVFKLAKKYDVKVVYASSSSVYGHQNIMPIKENAIREPINPYGQTKLDDEHLYEKYSGMGTSIIGLRYFNIFGEGQTPEYAGVITKFLERVREMKAPVIFGDGSQIRDFIFVQDIVMANLLAMTSNVNSSLINIGTGNAMTILELANMIIDISKIDLEPIFEKSLDGDIKKSHADISLAIQSLDWRPKKELNEWLKEII